jgi:hypothetical protein
LGGNDNLHRRTANSSTHGYHNPGNLKMVQEKNKGWGRLHPVPQIGSNQLPMALEVELAALLTL